MVAIKQNLSSGRYAVALVGYRGWMRNSAIGDGITAALNALLTRCDSKEEAEQLAAKLNAEQPAVRPGSMDVPMYDARRYAVDDYLSRQQRDNNQRRSSDRLIASL